MERRGWLVARLATCWLLAGALLGAHEALAQGALINGSNHTGSLAPGQEHAWTLQVAKDDALTISITETGGDTAYVPLVRLHRPDGVQIAISWGALTARLHVPVAPVSGTYTVVATGHGGSAGPYVLTVAQSPEPYVVPAGDDGGLMVNGRNHEGIAGPGDLDQWHFEAGLGDAVTLSIGEIPQAGPDPGFVPQIWLRSPSGQQLAIDWGTVTARLHVPSLPLTGTYTVVVGSQNLPGGGHYRLTLAHSPSAVLDVSPGDEGGTMVNGANHEGVIEPGDLDQWRFQAGQGDAVTVSIGELLASEVDPGFVPQIWLRSPTGQQLAIDWGTWAARLHVVTLPLTGTYTVVVGSQNLAAGGRYRVTLAHSPSATLEVPSGDEGGAMVNGVNHTGLIHVGDLDQWRFQAGQGDAVTIGIGEVVQGEVDPGFVPQLWLRAPNGQQLAIDWGGVSARLHVTTLPLTGTYTVVVASQNIAAGGAYTLTLAHSPADLTVPTDDQGGTLSNGGNHAGSIHVGDLDQWRFAAVKDDAVTISIGEVFVSEVDPGFVPQMWLRGPDGAQLAIDWNATTARLHVAALPSTGIYTVVVGNQNFATAGHYLLTMAHSPAPLAAVPTGDQGGALTNGANHPGVIHVGDLDQWQFQATKDDAIAVSIGEVFVSEVDPGFVPQMWLRSPTGAQLAINWGSVSTQLNVTAPVTGTYTVVVTTQNVGATGNYTLTLARTPAPFVTSSGDEGGPMTNGIAHAGAIHVGDLDLWTFQASLGSNISVNIAEVLVGEIDPGFVPWIRLRGPDGATIDGTWGATTATIALPAPASGLYTVVVGSQNLSTAGQYTLTVQGAASCLPTPVPTTITATSNGGTGTFAVSAIDDCPWTALSPVPWVVLSAASGNGNGSVSYTVLPNAEGVPRVATITLGTQTVTVTQLGAPVGTADGDVDGLPDDWETKYGLGTGDGSGPNGATGDPDGDGRTNLQEFQDDTHPRGFVITYLAEGATGAFFKTRLALANPTALPALVLVRYQKGNGEVIRQPFSMLPMSRTTIDVATVAGLEAAEFSTLVEADVQIVVDRTMTWDDRRYGAHAERGILAQAATTWYFAEGATHSGFQLFFLLQNPTTTPAIAEVTFLRPSPAAPLVKSYAVAPQSRFNIWVNEEARTDAALAGLATADISAVVRSANGVPIVAERAMYLNSGGLTFGSGHESAGVNGLSPTWFFAEGATGPFFDLFILVGNPADQDAQVQGTFLLPDGSTVVKLYTVGARSRFNIWVDLEDARLADTAVSTTLTSLNGVPLVAERAMWWPGTAFAPQWYEAHNSPGATSTGTRWAMAEGQSGGLEALETYVLIANTSGFAGEARVTLLFEDGTTTAQTFPLLANSRFNVAMSPMFPSSDGRRFGVLVESLGATPAQLVVERAMYSDAAGVKWAAGTNALATKLP